MPVQNLGKAKLEFLSGMWTLWTEIVKKDSSTLPPLDVPVWLFLPDVQQLVIGCRSDDGDGWLWGRCYDDFYYDKDAQIWKTDTCDTDDYNPSAWMPLPYPPRKLNGNFVK